MTQWPLPDSDWPAAPLPAGDGDLWGQADEAQAVNIMHASGQRGESLLQTTELLWRYLVEPRLGGVSAVPLQLCGVTPNGLTWLAKEAVADVCAVTEHGPRLLALLVGFELTWVLLDLWTAAGTRVLRRSSGAPRGQSVVGARRELRFHRSERVTIAFGAMVLTDLGPYPQLLTSLASGAWDINEYRFDPRIFATLRPQPTVDVAATPHNAQTALCVASPRPYPRIGLG